MNIQEGVTLIKEIDGRFLELLLVDTYFAWEGLCKNLKGGVYFYLFFISLTYLLSVCVHTELLNQE